MQRVSVIDVTLRDLTEGRSNRLLFREKTAIARAMSNLGADAIELPAISRAKEDAIIYKTISSLCSCGLYIPVTDDAAAAYACIQDAARPGLAVELPVSVVQMEYQYGMNEKKMLALMEQRVSSAKAVCPNVLFTAKDATRADQTFLVNICKAAIQAGATGICICDDAAVCLPEDISWLVSCLVEQIDVPLYVSLSDGIHAAVANAAAAIEAGADGVKLGMGGKGMKTADFADFLRVKGEEKGISTGLKLSEVHSDVESILKRIDHGEGHGTGSGAADRGGDVFLDGNSTAADVSAAARTLGYDLSPEDVGKVLDALLAICEKKSSLGAKEFEAIIASSAMQVPSTFHLGTYSISTSNKTEAMAHITLTRDEETLSGVAVGDGPIDSAFKAIEQCVGFHYELDDFQIQAVTEGKESLGATIVKLRSGGKLYSGNGLSPDIVGASIRAYLNALNKIVYEESR